MPRPVAHGSSYLPGLDGIRALAVIAVMGYHFGVPHMEGGLLGVGVFFTLSGFLITSILLSTWQSTGGFDLRNFWIRRARRLLPALAVMLIAVLAVTAAIDRKDFSARWHETLGAVVYLSNWATITSGSSYANYFSGPGPLDHLWSLAIEEQFYLIWPLLLLGVLRYCKGDYIKVAKLTLGLAAVSFILLAFLASPGLDNTRAYEGTDTRAGELLVGAALALAFGPLRRAIPHGRVRQVNFGIDLAGVAALAVVGWLVVSTTFYSMTLYRGGLVLLAAATAVVVAAVANPGSLLGRLLGLQPLRWIGERSYGIYLWHMPVYAFTPQNRLGEYSTPLAVVHVALTLILAALSWAMVEDPIRRYGLIGALRRVTPQRLAGGRLAPPVVVGAMALCLSAVLTLSVAGVVNPSSPAHTSADSLSMSIPAGRFTDQDSRAGGLPSKTEQSDPQPGRQSGADHGQDKSPTAGARWETSCSSVVHMGDSTSLGLMDPNYLSAGQRIDAQYHDVGVQNVHPDILGARSIVERYEGEPNAEDSTKERIDNGYDGCWVFAMGTNDTANQYVGGVVPLEDRIARLMDAVDGQPAMWLTVKTRLSSGPWAEEQMQKWNDALLDACQKYPNMRVYDWASQVRDSWFIDDGIHFSSTGYQERAQRTARSLAVAFPKGGTSPAGCLVVPTSTA